MRGASFVATALALSACSQGESAPPPKAAEGDEHIECALGPGMGFVRDCAIERSRPDGVHKMIVRHPDGGFRRFEVDRDNTIVVTDGADAAQVSVTGTVAEVTVGEDRYRIPLQPADVQSETGIDAPQL